MAGPSMSKHNLAHFARVLREREGQLRRQIDAARQRAAGEQFTVVASEAPDFEDAAFAIVVGALNNAEIGRRLEDLRSVREALARIDAGSYGVCNQCGELIAVERLEAFPTAECDVEHQKDAERQAGQLRASSL
jgi:DnaK suppressor protein